MYFFAYALLLVAQFCSLACAGLAIVQIRQRQIQGASLAEKGHWAVTACLLLASALLLHALFWKDYRLDYVASYTDNILDVFYRLTAFWAGQPGSMLFWALAVSAMGTIFACTRSCRELQPETRLWFWAFFHIVMAFFALILTVWSNPFAMTLPAPADGRGLNPLLQNPGMIIHPPLLFLGYGGFTVPSCLALAIACSSQGALEKPWHRISRTFCLTAGTFLTAGILLGCWWAYMELGWGGYWGWDPVENASLIPWLVATATFHTLAMERRRGLLARTNVFLISLTTIAGFFATYLVRSGVIDSVHAFGQSPVGAPLLVFICAMLLLSAGIAFQSPRRGRALTNPASREGLLVLTVCTLLALAAIILLATMWPVVSRLWTQAPQGLDAKFYNRVCLPLGTLVALALALCPLLSWKGAFDARRGLPVLLLAALAAGLCAFLGYARPHPLAATFAASAAIGGLALFMLLKLLGRPSSDFSLGALGCHLGLALFVLGVAFSGPYKNEADLSFVQGEPQTLGGYELVLKDLQQGRQPGYEFLLAEIEVMKDGRAVGILRPEKRAYDKFGGMFFTEVDVLPSLGEELYASLSGMDGRGRAVAKVSVEPLVNWLWIGGTLMSLMPLLALRRRKTKAEAQ